MNVIVPLGGVGSRFQREGYLAPKPFVRILGKEMILWVIDSLTMSRDDTLVVVYNPKFLDMKFEIEIVLDKYPDCVLVELPRSTLGAAETVRFGLEGLTSRQRARPCVLVDGDTFYSCDIISKYRAISAKAGASFVFHDTQPKPIYSYVTKRANNAIESIVEKVKISDWANTGCYCFQNGNVLLEYCAKIIERGETQLSQDQKAEFYTSGVIRAMLEEGLPFEAIVLDKGDMHVLGTPTQVQEFCLKTTPTALRFCFDVDNTLFTSPTKAGDYTTCRPIKRTVDLLKALYAQGHYIILNTARRMRTHGGNVGALVADVGLVTLKSLDDARIPYHEIHFGKPWAQFYIDDHAINAFADLEKELGFYLPLSQSATPTTYTSPPPLGGSDAARKYIKQQQGHPRAWSFFHMTVAFYALAITSLYVASAQRRR